MPSKALPIRLLPIGHLLGVHEGIESLALPVAISTSGSRNVWMDKLARATSIDGYTKRNATPVTSVLGAPMHLTGLYHYTVFNPATGDVRRLQLGMWDDDVNNHLELHTSADGGRTWTRLSDYGGGLLDSCPDFAQLGNQLVIVIGNGAAKSYDGTTFADVSNTQLAAPTTVDGGSVGQLAGRYRWWIVPLKSDGTRKVASLPSAPLILNLRTATVSWVADTDTSVTGYEIYRTFGEGAMGFFDGAVNGRTTVTYTSILDDQTLALARALAEYGEAPPPNISFVETHKLRMWYGRTKAFPRRWYFSDPGLPYSVHLDTNYVDATDAESMSDATTGATGGYTRSTLFGGDDMFVIWLERSVWTVTGTGRVQSAVLTGAATGNVIDWDLKRSNARIGTVSHRTVARIPKGAMWFDPSGAPQTTGSVLLAYLTPFGDIRTFDGIGDEIISHSKQDTLQRLTYSARRKAFAVTDTARSEVIWHFPVDGSEDRFMAVAWNYRYGTWTERDWPLSHAAEIEEDNDSSVLLGGEQDPAVGGYLYQLWDTHAFDGVTVRAAVMTKTLYGSLLPNDKFDMPGLMAIEKRWRWLQFLVKSDLALDLLVEWWGTEGDEDTDTPFASRTIVGAGQTLVTADGSTLTSTDASELQTARGVGTRVERLKLVTSEGRFLHARGVRFRISSASTAVWSIVGLAIGYQLLPGLKRSFRR